MTWLRDQGGETAATGLLCMVATQTRGTAVLTLVRACFKVMSGEDGAFLFHAR